MGQGLVMGARVVVVEVVVVGAGVVGEEVQVVGAATEHERAGQVVPRKPHFTVQWAEPGGRIID